jgi:hypothetical protein
VEAQCEGIIEFNDVSKDLWWLYAIVLLAIFFGFRILSLLVLTIKARNFAS